MENTKPIILFDGVCNLCSASVSFILRRDKRQQFDFISLQSNEGKQLLKQFQVSTEIDSVILIHNQKVFIESDAAIAISKFLPFPWNWARIFKVIPKNWRDRIYRWVAKNRYRWFGKRNSVCHFEEGTT